jgi:hypothetical protein
MIRETKEDLHDLGFELHLGLFLLETDAIEHWLNEPVPNPEAVCKLVARSPFAGHTRGTVGRGKRKLSPKYTRGAGVVFDVTGLSGTQFREVRDGSSAFR